MKGVTNMPPLAKKAEALQLNIEGLLKLLGGSAEDRERFFEIVLGITSRAESKLVESALSAATQNIAAVRSSMAAVQAVASQAGRTR
jgi:hypothetical protein